MSWYLLLKLAHILCVVAFLAGLIGRTLVRLRIPAIGSFSALQETIVLVGHFDDWLVIRGSQLTLVTGLLLGWAGGWPYLAAGHPTWILVALILFLSLIPLVIFIFLPRGRAFATVFKSAIAVRQITPELRAALADPAVRAATVYEFIASALIVGLMVLKPF